MMRREHILRWDAACNPAVPAREAVTDLLGKRPVKLDGRGTYRSTVRPQQIVTLRLQTEQSAPPVKALTTWSPIVPPAKRDYVRSFRRVEMKGHTKPTP